MAKVILFGAGQIAEMAYSYLTHQSPHEVAALTVDGAYLDRKEHLGLPVVAFEQAEELYPPDEYEMFVAVSYRSMNRTRAEKCMQARGKGYRLITHVSPHAVVSPDATLGDNCIICEHSVVQPFVRVGDGVIMGDGNHVGHHTVIGDYCFVTSHVVVCGGVQVGPRSFLGVNSTIRDRITIGAECVIGAGALILRDTPARSIYVGAAARRLPGDTTAIYDF